LPVRLDVAEDVKVLAGIQRRIRALYAATQNNKTIRKGFLALVQPLLEVRYVWEHFSDALLDGDNQWNTDADLIHKEMEKARTHSLRCYTDLTEWRFLQIKVYAKEITKWLTKEDIKSAIPGYYDSVFRLYGEIDKTFVALKNVPEINFEKRVELLDQANENCEIILAALNESALKELRRKSAAHLVFSVLKYLAATAIGGLLIPLLVQYLTQSSA
jgi:hypothetical protein